MQTAKETNEQENPLHKKTGLQFYFRPVIIGDTVDYGLTGNLAKLAKQL